MLLLDGTPSLLIFSALTMPMFRSVKVRSKRPQCPACGEEGIKIGKIEENDYVAFCGGLIPDWETLGKIPGNSEERMTATVRHSSFAHTTKPVWLTCKRILSLASERYDSNRHRLKGISHFRCTVANRVQYLSFGRLDK